MKKAKLKNLTTGKIIKVHSATDSPDSSYGFECWVDHEGNSYGQIQFGAPFGFELVETEEGEDNLSDDHEPTPYGLVYDHELLRHYVPSAKAPHIEAMDANGLLDELTPEQAAKVVLIAQTAYRNGQVATGAERIDSDAVWINGVGGIEKQPDGSWKLTMPDGGIDATAAATELGRRGGKSTSEAKADAARENGRKGGRPRKDAT